MPSLVRPDGCRIHYELFGDPGSPALILLEGIGADIAGWRRNIPTLASELRVACVFDAEPNLMTHLMRLLVLSDANVSREHAELRPRGGGWTIADLGSTNGVAVKPGMTALARIPSSAYSAAMSSLRRDSVKSSKTTVMNSGSSST